VPAPTTGVPLIGRVASYDAGRGLGTVAAGDDGLVHVHPVHTFHCTAIADGSRAIEVGTRVAFVLVAGLGGVLEARAVTRIVAAGGD